MRSVYTAIAVIGIALPARAFADAPLAPEMSADRPVMCLRDASDQVWRIQCDPRTRVCLYAPNDELDSTGGRTKPLERARTCELAAPFDRAEMEKQGFTFIAGRVDAPYGWVRGGRRRGVRGGGGRRRRRGGGGAGAPQK